MNGVPSAEQAESLLKEAEARNPGSWVAHSRNAAKAAQLIAEQHPELNEHDAYVFGLLHDIGRREGVTGMRHALDGYTFLKNLGFDNAARICLTHSFPVQNVHAIFGEWDVTPEELDFVDTFLSGLRYNDYDRLLQLCDCLALPRGICLLEKRMIDVALRYGVDEYTVDKWRGYVVLQTYFDDLVGGSIYALLPGVVETTFGLRVP